MTKIIFGSNEGNAKSVAEYIGAKLGASVINAADLRSEDLAADGLIFVASTHKGGTLQADMRAKLDLIADSNLNGKKVALVGLGGLGKHADAFCDGLAELLPALDGAQIVGEWGADGYPFTASKAFKDGKFVGLTLDLKFDPEWQKRTDKWLEILSL